MPPLSYVHAFAPSHTFHNLILQLYSSADAIVLLNAATLRLIRVFTFQEVFPGLQSLGERVSCIAVDPAMKIVRPLVLITPHLIFAVDRGFHKHAHCSMVHVRRSDGYMAYPLVPCLSRRGLCFCLGLPLW